MNTVKNLMSTFGERLSELRKGKDLSQAELGKIFKLGQSTIGMYETDKREPDMVTIKQFANFFGCSIDYILGHTDIRETPEQRIESVISDEPDLLEFWQELKQREDLQLLFKQVKPLSEESIKRIIRYIKMVEDEESRMDY